MQNLNVVVILTVLTALGAGFSAAAFFMGVLYSTSSARLAERMRSLRPVKHRQAKKETRDWSPFHDTKTTLACLGGAVCFGGIAWGTPYLSIAMPSGSFIAMAVMLGVRHLRNSSDKFLQLREAALLYESIDLFGQAGFTVRQAMQLSLPLVSKLRPALEKCIEHWGGGSMRAIEQLGNDIGISEADVLISVLMHAEEVGTAKLSGVMEEESSRIDELRQTLAEMRVAGKPIYATAYIFLPVATLLGIIMGPLAYRAILMISNLRSPGGM